MGTEQQKKGQIQIFAKNIRGVAQGQILEESRYTKNTAGGRHVQNGSGGGVNNDANRGRQIPKTTEVLEIERLTDLDDGSANDGTGTNTKKGLIFGKTYTFKVKKYTNGAPANLKSIRWALSYTDPDTGVYYENNLQGDVRGETIKIAFTGNTNTCGCNVEIKAYISNIKKGGVLKIWKHNRFRWFDGKRVEDELKERVDNKKPWSINQSGTSLCGMACLFYLFAKEQPQAYKTFAKRLFRTGEATFNQYTVKPAEELLEKKVNTKGYPMNTGSMPLIDYVTLAGTRNTDNPKYKGGDEEFRAINWPWVVTNLSEKLLGYKEVSSNGVYDPTKKPRHYNKRIVWKMIEDINEQISQGYRLMLMIDSDLIDETEDKLSNLFALEYHWVVLETPITTLQNLNGKGEIFYTLQFKVYSWGGNTVYLKAPITMDHFIHNYYGYVKVK